MGYVPSVAVAYFMSVITMIAWGSWSVTQRKCGNWRFEAWYIDFAVTIVGGTFLVGLILTALSPVGWSLSSYFDPPLAAIAWALFAGVVWGAGNFLLAAAIRLAGLALAFPIGIGLALALGTFLAYITNPSATAHPVYLFIGLALILMAIGANGLAQATKHAHIPVANIRKGVFVAVLCGILISFFPFPFNFAFDKGLSGEAGAFYLTLGALPTSLILLYRFMRHPLSPKDKPTGLNEYKRAKPAWHAWAVLAGVVWSIGTVCNLVVANQPKFSVAIAYTLGQCAAMVAALWGLFVWKEFKGAPARAYHYLGLMFFFFLSGIVFLSQATG